MGVAMPLELRLNVVVGQDEDSEMLRLTVQGAHLRILEWTRVNIPSWQERCTNVPGGQ